ncbi:MAG TPA: ATP-binding cassette domain-containing protein [Bacteroidales bacterium]|jgi:ABC-type multidrug transport system ATPase subunit|nr:ATP-binding cassette domain-containing protein [Bacteroidales bacterium]HOO65656.1 ATP-binding cassette domain-containing protein [Bacteroidales bacterium]HPE21627.1 ATP-binding cassette domain-containing protein [Bacteroidales bacterium]HPJ04426.1 ATP-binding cassette domain-containing protein [Bacteroidales bacterium]HPQ62946.1 ATP-binding cassette domain-containing protein [Bacteroidales bacterium]
MNEKILNTLMHLFAIIAPAQGNESDRRQVVEAFLRPQLNQEGVQAYLKIFDAYYAEAQERLKKGKEARRNSSISVRIIKICFDIGMQLTLNQKIIVLVQLLEYCRSDNAEVSNTELEFIITAAEGFNINPEDYQLIRQFVLSSRDEVLESPQILLIDSDRTTKYEKTHHIINSTIRGQVRVLNLPQADLLFIRSFGTGEMLLSGQLRHEDRVYLFERGSSLKFMSSKPIYYSEVIRQFLDESALASRVVYEVNNIEYRFKGGQVGLHRMSFAEESGRLIGIMGASGAGKSTLLSVLNGTNRPDSGEVLINGVNIHNDPDKIKGLIGYVSQDDLLIEELTVFENLFYNAKLCFGNLNDEDIAVKVDEMLHSLGLHEIKDMKVGTPLNKKISGGQRKRLNISLELIREPAILFLDEPTSGLSSLDSENILDLLNDLKLKGKLIFVVIHQPSSDIFKMFDRLIFLDTGGFMIYYGIPVGSIGYFKDRMHLPRYNDSECPACGNVNPEQIFSIVESKVLDEFGRPTATRKVSPSEWSAYYNSRREESPPQPRPGNGIPEITLRTPGKLKQFMVFVKRDILAKLSDAQYLVITLLEAPVLAFFLAYIIRYFDESASNPSYTLLQNSNLPVYIFMSVIVAIFMGLTVSAEEIIKDRKILRRESFLNLSWNSYLLSKIGVQFLISAIQAASFVAVGNTIFGIRGMWFEYWLVLFSCWATSNMMGLLISDSFKTVVTIYILIPFLVIPQIILSGIIVKYDKLNPNISSPISIPVYGEVIAARWGYEALAVDQFINNRFERQFYNFDKAISIAKFRKDIWYNEMKSILSRLESNIERERLDESSQKDMELIINEITEEMGFTTAITFDLSLLDPGRITTESVNAAREYIEKVRRYYIEVSRNAVEARDQSIMAFESADREAFIRMKKQYTNESLEEFVRNDNEKDKIKRYRDRLYQNYDQIFFDPVHPLVKAHFYAPRKQVFGIYAGTLAVNTAVIWVMTLALYILLYFRVLHRILDSLEKFMRVMRDRREKNKSR